MKTARIISFGILFFLSLSGFAQYEESDQARILNIKLRNDLNQAVPSFVIQVSNSEADKGIRIISDKAGNIEVPVETGHEYTIKDNEENLLDKISIPKNPTAPLIKTIIVSKPVISARLIYDTVSQKPEYSSDNENVLEARITIRVWDLDRKLLQNIKVRLVCSKYGTVYTATTNASGVARFQVLIGGDYNLGIQELENLKVIRVPAVSGTALVMDVPYQPTDITEITRNDTVYQEYIPRKKATFSRAFLEVIINDYEHRPLPGEPVYLAVVGKPTVYTAMTDRLGKAYFLLPYGNDYVVNLTYERDIFLCSYPLKEGVLREDEAFVTYRGTAQIREFFKNARRDQQGFITEFHPVEVKKIGFDASNVIKTKHGYNVNFPAKSETPPPAILNNKDVIQGGGYFSKDVYSFNNKTGLFNWGLQLGDNGVSASVCAEDFLVITTESCTLYAIDARTGELAWSKWLGPELNSTPTVANGKVYAVYPAKLDAVITDNKPYAVICFDLKTGNIIWQNWIDSEPLGSPVANGKSLYITTSLGNLHQFDNSTGKVQRPLKNGRFTSPPTISGGIVYLSRRIAEKPEQERIEAFLAATLAPAGLFPSMTINAKDDISSLSPSELMNYCSGRPLVFLGKLYAVSGKSLVCFDAKQFTKLWTIDLSKRTGMMEDEFAAMPAAVNKKIVVSTLSGKVLVVDPLKGEIETTYDLESALKFQPVISDGWIYAGSKEGKLISYNTGNPLLTGWPMWSMNAAHNPVVE